MRRLPLALALLAASAPAYAQADLLKRIKPASVGKVDENGVYQLSEEEKGYNCKKLTGRMQVRILEIRDYHERTHGSTLAQGLKSIGSSLAGSRSSGASADARYRSDVAMLEAYNRQLASKKCRTFNLEAELTPKPAIETPTPAPRAKAP